MADGLSHTPQVSVYVLFAASFGIQTIALDSGSFAFVPCSVPGGQHTDVAPPPGCMCITSGCD
eukprot:4913071-Amphidinium_carterae.1